MRNPSNTCALRTRNQTRPSRAKKRAGFKTPLRRRLELEALDRRVLLAAGITAFDLTAGTVTITGDMIGSANETLSLSETVVGADRYLTHNLSTLIFNGFYSDNMDVDPGLGTARLKIGSGTAPLVTVNLLTGNDRLSVENSWTFNHKIAFDGGTGTDTLQGPNAGPLSWNVTGSTGSAFSGNITNTTKFTFANVEALGGGSTADTLVGQNVPSTWSLDATKRYNNGVGNLTLNNFEIYQGGTAADVFNVTAASLGTLRGGAGADTYQFANGVTLTGSIDGQGGDDTLSLGDYSANVTVALTAATANGFSGTSTGVSGGFAGIDNIEGGTGEDTLTGASLPSVWTMDGAPRYTAGGSTLSFMAFETLQGNTDTDTFNLVGDGLLLVNTTLKGGAGADSFNFSDGVLVTGNIDGQAGNDTLNYAGYSVGIVVALTTAATSNGFAGTEYLGIGGSFAGIDILNGSSSDDYLIGRDVNSTWTINTTRTYKEDALANTLTFSSFEDLQGGSGNDLFDIFVNPAQALKGGDGNDTFRVRNGITSSSGFHGEGDSDTLDFSLYTTARSVALTSADPTGFSGTDSVSAGFTGINTVIGGTAADTLTGFASGTWNLNAAQTYVSGANSLTFSSFQSLQGGSGVDTFNVLANTTADLFGNGGADSFVFSDGRVLTGTAAGGTGSDTLSMSSYSTSVSATLSSAGADGFSGSSSTGAFTGIDVMSGGSASDTLTGLASGTWNLNASQTYVASGSTLTFSSFQSLQGGSGVDTFNVQANTSANLFGNGGADAFVFSDGRTLTGTLDGGAASDTLNLSAYSTDVAAALTSAAANGFSGNAASGGFAGIDVITGGTSADTITGLTAGTWNLNTTQTYVASGSTLTFSSFFTLRGGTGVDTYRILANTTADLLGRDGADSFIFSDGAVLTGNASGGVDLDTFDMSAYTTAVSATLALAAASGFSGSTTSATGFSAIDVLIGGSGADTLNGLASGTWNLNTAQTYVSGAGTLTFSSFQELQGGSGIDTFNVLANTTANLYGNGGTDSFVISNARVLTGSASGGAGVDTLTMAAYTTPVSASLTGTSVDGFAGTSTGAAFSGIDVVRGGTAADTLTGLATGTWNLNTTQTYVSASTTLEFSSFQSLQGGSGFDGFNVIVATTADLYGNGGHDSFVLSDGAVLTGTAAGGTGTDTLTMAAYTTNVAAVLTSSDASGFSGTSTGSSSFSGIDILTAGSGSNNSITGENVASAWSVSDAGSSYNDSTYTLNISTFQTYQGGSNVDTFAVVANAHATLLGGGGADAFNISDAVVLTGSIDGQAGADTLNLGAYTSATLVTLTGSNATNGLAGTATGLSAGFAGINEVFGSTTSSGDILAGRNLASTWTIDSTRTYSDGTASLAFSSFEALQGGSAIDTFNVFASTALDLMGGASNDVFHLAAEGVTLDGLVDGEDGTDKIDYTGYTSPVEFNIASGTTTGVSNFQSIESVQGGAGANTIIGSNLANNWTITSNNTGSVSSLDTIAFAAFANLTGGGSSDVFTFANGVGVTGAVAGGGGTDTLSFAGYSAANGVNIDISANNAGSATSTGVSFTFGSMENLTGGAGNDTFTLGNGRSLTGSIVGGSGTDTLSYAAYTTSVRVDLTTGAAIGVKASAAGGVSGIENIAGGSANDILIGDGAVNVLAGNGGNDILVGNDGADVLQGALGRDILIGGNGADAIDGGAGDDLLIAGRTSHDASIAALNALMSEWSSTDSYATRIGHLTGSIAGGRNGTRLLNATTVFDDTGAVDSLTGGPDLDWFLAFVTDMVVDLNNGGPETLTIL